MILIDGNDTNEIAVYAAMHYRDKHRGTIDDFNEALSHFRDLCKALSSASTNPRITLNHFIILCNSFALTAVIEILRRKIDIAIYPRLNALLVFLDLEPEATPVDVNLLNKFKEL